MGAVVVEGEELPDRDPKGADQAEDRAKRGPGWKLAGGNPPPMRDPDLPERESANDQGGGLGPGVPPELMMSGMKRPSTIA